MAGLSNGVKVRIDMRNDLLEGEVTFLRVLQKMGEKMDRMWKDLEKNPEKKEEDVWQWVEKRLNS
jgi:hypothetical protein